MKKITRIIILILVLSILICFIGITKSNAADEENTIKSIGELNYTKDELDSHAQDTNNSRLESDFREKIEFDKDDLDSENSDLKYIVYPRLKKLTKEDSEGYRYILTFQNCYISENGTRSSNGENVYYTRSKDLKTWEKPQELYTSEDKVFTLNTSEGKEEKTKKYNYSSCDTYVLSDGRIMSVASKYAVNTGYYTMEQFKECGIYARFSDDNGKSWSEDKRIYAGLCWEPSVIQLKSGEIHVYFTHSAHVTYMNGYEGNYGNGWIARISPQSQSGSVAMLSSIDNGNSWSPNIEGTEESYNPNVRNPYSAYRIVQQFVKWKDDHNTRVNYKNLFYGSILNSIDQANNKITSVAWGRNRGITIDKNTVIKMTDQMAVAKELNNGKMVMAVETSRLTTGKDIQLKNVTVIEDGKETKVQKAIALDTGEELPNGKYENLSSSEEKTIKRIVGEYSTSLIHDISLAYSEKKKVNIVDKDGNIITKEKFWLDLSDDTDISNKTYSSEEEVYAGEGLGIAQEGPINKNSDFSSGAAPYITQFPSGETVLTYLENEGDNKAKTILRLGDENGDFSNNNNITLATRGTWNSIELLSSHCVMSSIAKTQNDKESTKAIELNKFYLNHTINADYLNKEIIDSKNIEWNDNTDALFIGSESQAQATIRVAYDKNNLYFLVDRLDNNIQDEDKIELYINVNEKNNDYYKIILSKEGAENIYFHSNGKDELLNNNILSSKIIINDTKDELGGYKVLTTISKEGLEKISDKINLNAILYNKDSEETVIEDTFEGIDLKDVTTWNKVKFVEQYFNIIKDYEKIEKYIIKIKPNTKLSEFIKDVDTNMKFTFQNKKGENVTDMDKNVVTGMKIKLSNEDEFIMVVEGDLNSDGICDVSDMGVIAAKVVGKEEITNEYFKAGDLNYDNSIDISDLSIIANSIVK